MFQSTHHLPQRLNREHYTSPEVYQLELERMFLPGWHLLGAWVDAPNLGDFFTRELFGRPLVCWKTSHGYQAFLNVCSHRFCALTDKPRGRFEQRLKCQYHGWEYDEEGNTCKIPDAQHFRPLAKGELGLKEYRTETLGQLIFVTLNDKASSLREYLGPQITAWCERCFTPDHRLTFDADMDLDANWKIVAENVVEGYHLPSVHSTSFGTYPEADRCTHEFHPTYNYYKHDSSDHKQGTPWEMWIAWASSREPELCWEHFIRYPNLTFGGTGPWHYVQVYYPTSISTCRSLLYTMHYSGPKGRLWPFLVHRFLKRVGTRIGRQINREDAVLYPSIHHGMSSTDQPHGGGLISAREERIFPFQDYILKSLSSDGREPVVPLPPPCDSADSASLTDHEVVAAQH